MLLLLLLLLIEQTKVRKADQSLVRLSQQSISTKAIEWMVGCWLLLLMECAAVACALMMDLKKWRATCVQSNFGALQLYCASHSTNYGINKEGIFQNQRQPHRGRTKMKIGRSRLHANPNPGRQKTSTRTTTNQSTNRGQQTEITSSSS
jgi:hypothetical protein